MDWVTRGDAWVAFATLTALEMILGVDNVIFISILAGKLQEGAREKARRIGLVAAMAMRILLLFGLTLIIRLTAPFFSVLGNEISGRDLILIIGGLFLIAKATREIHEKVEGGGEAPEASVAPTLRAVIFQIMLLDVVFSLDSVITAVGMADDLGVMVSAVVVSVAMMLFVAKPVGEFVERHPTVKLLALSFLLLIGMALLADGLDHHIPKGYIYFAMGFACFIEVLNFRMRAKSA